MFKIVHPPRLAACRETVIGPMKIVNLKLTNWTSVFPATAAVSNLMHTVLIYFCTALPPNCIHVFMFSYMKDISPHFTVLFLPGVPQRWRDGYPSGQRLRLPGCCHFTPLRLPAGKSHRQREGPADSSLQDEPCPGWVQSARGQGRTNHMLALMGLVLWEAPSSSAFKVFFFLFPRCDPKCQTLLWEQRCRLEALGLLWIAS